jgi:broad specificity phosphatase PhoE
VTSRVVLIAHAATPATRHAAFPVDESISSHPDPVALLADAFVAGPEARCRETATALGLTATTEESLRDCDYGAWRGRTLDDLTATDPTAVTRWLTDPTAAPHGGESTVDLIARVATWLDALRLETARTVAVTHPAVVKAAVVHAIRATPESFWRVDVPPLSRTVLSGRPAAWTLSTLGCPSDH